MKEEKKEARRNRENLADSYIKKLLTADGCLKCSDIPPDLIQMKREQLEIYRLNKQLKQALKERKA